MKTSDECLFWHAITPFIDIVSASSPHLPITQSNDKLLDKYLF